jgi:hypothetical protein
MYVLLAALFVYGLIIYLHKYWTFDIVLDNFEFTGAMQFGGMITGSGKDFHIIALKNGILYVNSNQNDVVIITNGIIYKNLVGVGRIRGIKHVYHNNSYVRQHR